jgi:hypothetical protein
MFSPWERRNLFWKNVICIPGDRYHTVPYIKKNIPLVYKLVTISPFSVYPFKEKTPFFIFGKMLKWKFAKIRKINFRYNPVIRTLIKMYRIQNSASFFSIVWDLVGSVDLDTDWELDLDPGRPKLSQKRKNIEISFLKSSLYG